MSFPRAPPARSPPPSGAGVADRGFQRDGVSCRIQRDRETGAHMPCLILRRIRSAHCKLGPERCTECRVADEGRICLLEVHPPGGGLAQRRLIPLERDGETVWWEYDVVRSFSGESEARSYAEEHGIDDVEL